jgi:hypothetical protein
MEEKEIKFLVNENDVSKVTVEVNGCHSMVPLMPEKTKK